MSYRISLAKLAPKLLLSAVSALLALVAAEVTVRWLDLMPVERAIFDSYYELTDGSAKEQDADSQQTAEPPAASSKMVVHPFLGWSRRADGSRVPLRRRGFPDSAAEQWYRSHNRINTFGIPSAIEDFRQLNEEDFVVGLFGGSVALNLALEGGDAIIRRLQELRPELRGRIRLINLAFGGYKQPQQLNLLAQCILLDVPLDVVVNLDGFNELALGVSDASRGDHPLFPYRDYLALAVDFASGSPSEAEIEATAELLLNRRRTEYQRSFAQRHPHWATSALLRAMIGYRVRVGEARSVELESGLSELGDSRSDSLASLDDPCLSESLPCLQLIADIWRDASLSMAALSERFGAVYLHLLQPNQHLEGTKPLSNEERQRFYNPHRLWSRATVAGYPLLLARGEELRRRQIYFRDLTGVFRDHPETLYRDPCCHPGPLGNRLLGEAVGAEIAAALTRH